VIAVVHDRYGPPSVLRLEEVPRPAPGDGEILVKVHATSVTRTDCHVRAADTFGTRFVTGTLRPKQRISGGELSGEVAEVGAAVTEFAPGDAVFGLSPWKFGTHAEFVSLPENGPIALKPAGIGYVEAAGVCDGAVLALNQLRPAGLGEGKRILIFGASGSIGTAAVQLSAYFGAEVTAVCGTKNLELMRSLGATQVIDFTREDFTRNGERYDAVFDAVGKHSFRRCLRSIAPGGFFIATDQFRNIALAALHVPVRGRRVIFPVPPRFEKDDVAFLRGLIEGGHYRAVIDRTYPLDQVVEAASYVESQQKTGNVVLTVVAGDLT